MSVDRGSNESLIPLVEPAGSNDIMRISEDLGLDISADDLPHYHKFISNFLSDLDQLRNLPEEELEVKYPRVPGKVPHREDNPLNAWATKGTIQGAVSGLLAGKTLAVKDNVFVAGYPLYNGSKIWDGFMPSVDATVVTRALDAGATIVGKSTCESQCCSGNSHTSASGPVLNPHDRTRSAGGSSSGSAVLVATKEVDMAIGGDQGGSIRLPSCWCGVVGLKPTYGLVPCTGSLGLEPSIDHVGPIASTVTDVALLLEAIAGYDGGRDPRQHLDVPVQQYSQMLLGDLKGKRFALLKEGTDISSDGVKGVIEEAVKKIQEVGGIVESVSIPEHKMNSAMLGAIFQRYYQLLYQGNSEPLGGHGLYDKSAMLHMFTALKSRAHEMQPMVKAISVIGKYLEEKNGNLVYAKAMNQRPTLRKAYDKVLDSYDCIIMPTIPYVASKLPQKGCNLEEFLAPCLANTANTPAFNLTGHPALTLNAGFAAPDDDPNVKLPVGLMLACKHFEDAKVLDLAYGLEKIF